MVGDAKRDPSLPEVTSIQRVDRHAKVDRFFEVVTERRWGFSFDREWDPLLLLVELGLFCQFVEGVSLLTSSCFHVSPRWAKFLFLIERLIKFLRLTINILELMQLHILVLMRFPIYLPLLEVSKSLLDLEFRVEIFAWGIDGLMLLWGLLVRGAQMRVGKRLAREAYGKLERARLAWVQGKHWIL